MKKSYLTAVLTLTCLLGLGISARAQDTKGVRVNVPFEFVAGGATLPAGTYTIGRLSVDASSGIAIRGYGNGALAYVREIASRTEQYWCPIKHALKVTGPHQRYYEFLEYGDAEGYRTRLDQLRERLRQDAQPDAPMSSHS